MPSLLETKIPLLNSHWVPLRTVNLRRMILLVFGGRAEIVGKSYQTYDFAEWQSKSQLLKAEHPDLDGETFVYSVNFALYVPQATRLTKYSRIPTFSFSLNKKAVFERDSYECQYCRVKLNDRTATIAHVIPRSRGGENEWANVVTVCSGCNSRKRNHVPLEAGMKLLKTPREPKPYHKTLALEIEKVLAASLL